MLYVELTIADDDEKKKVTLFSYLVGESGRELLDMLMGDAARDTWKLTDIIKKFDGHCNPCVNETVECYRFFTKNQSSSEAIDSYVTELKLLAKTCHFGPLRDSLIRDRIVCGINNASMRERLLCEKICCWTHAYSCAEPQSCLVRTVKPSWDQGWKRYMQYKEQHARDDGMLLGKDVVKFQIDCGATCNIIPINLLNPDTKLEHTKSVLVMYNKSRLRLLGKCKVKLRNPRNQKLYQLEFQVVDGDDVMPLLGKKASEAMKLIRVHYENIMAIDSIVTAEKPTNGKWSMEQIKAEYADVFTGDGCLEGKYKIEVDKNVKPVQLPKRRVPV